MGRRSKRSNRNLLVRVSIFIMLLFGIWLLSLFQFVNQMPSQVNDFSRKTDAIVVLTGGSKRLEEGLQLLEKKLSKRLFVSGVYKGTEVRSLLQHSSNKQSNLASQVAIGNAENTEENALETSEWVAREKLESIRLVTAAYHMPRSLLEFRYAMPKVVIIPHPVFPGHVKQDRWWAYPGTAMLLMSEYNKLIFAWVRQRLDFLF